jgi:hypothetical protein
LFVRIGAGHRRLVLNRRVTVTDGRAAETDRLAGKPALLFRSPVAGRSAGVRGERRIALDIFQG